MKTFEEFLAEGKLYATTKDGVRKHVQNDREAAEVRGSYHDPKKDPSYVKPKATPKPGAVDHEHLARKIEMAVGDHYPDTDGSDSLISHIKKTYPHVKSYEYGDHLDKAAKKHLGAKSFGDYVEKFHSDQDKISKREH